MLDHLVYSTPDLAGTVDELRERGVDLVPGGPHDGLGTRNFIGPLGGSAYLEVVGPDPDQPAPARPRPFRIDELTVPTLVTWAVATTDIDTTVARARAAGHDAGVPFGMARRRPDGVLISWRIAFPVTDWDGLAPVLIDWGDAPHPSGGLPGGTRLESLRATHPDPGGVSAALAVVGAELAVTAGEPGLVAELSTPAGRVVLR
ncbi:VOC family protein [Amycolatopsis suaedae]|uniref:VOC family protein n=1 Tax=Amycolatopsis suaedae TaxID=2510978 RepID=A0A4Q7J8K4_9PSEU|nr:VOC family protein [Amycolatopsis suaedae]RZQ63246.1 VOC family protein [Amycolatopsis suaedae]